MASSDRRQRALRRRAATGDAAAARAAEAERRRLGIYSFFVGGRPRTKGSMRFVPSASTGQPVPVPRSPAKQNWQGVVSTAAVAAGIRTHEEAGVCLSLDFFFARPKSHYGSGKNAERLKPGAPRTPTSRATGDVDKLARAVCDGLTGIAYRDDSQVVLLVAAKHYAGRWQPEGVQIHIAPDAEGMP